MILLAFCSAWSYLLVAFSKNFSPNAIWYEITEDYLYDSSTANDIVIKNPCIRMAQRLLAYGIFAREDSLNTPYQSKLHFLSSMMNGDRINPGSLLAT